MRRKDLNILFLESSKNFGGQERRLLFEATWLVEAGHDVIIACPRDSLLYERSLTADHSVYTAPMRKSVEISSVIRLAGLIRRRNINIMYSHSGKDSWIGGIVGLLTGIPLVRSRELLNTIRHSSAYNMFPKRVLACSEAVKNHLVQNGVDEGKVYVQYPPVDISRFRDVSPDKREAVRQELRLEVHFPVIVCVGEMRAEKRQIDLVHAMKYILENFPSARLLLVGRDSGITGVKEAAESEGVVEHVIFLGEREDVPSILSVADVYVFPSSVEPFGMGPVEAMAAGVPVIVTRTGGLQEIVTDGVSGLQIPPESPQDIADAVAKICSEPELRERLRVEGLLRCVDFDAPIAMENLLRHFNEVVSG
ncbi:glycosyltransferase family 1 protein [bacterium]|nr:MAG: glycosyltransferase family 1 protein [bacterium]